MPPRLPNLRFGAALCLRPAPTCTQPCMLPFISSANASTKTKRKHVDPYRQAQSRQRKAANVTRQAELTKERNQEAGDPVRGITTPFVQSFDRPDLLNHFLKPSEIERSLQHSYILTQPILNSERHMSDPALEQNELQAHEADHQRATEALNRILALPLGNQKDRTRANIQRCIDTFGRHATDPKLAPRAPSQQPHSPEKTPLAEKTPRAGPDTGSSEVQIAILTAKIRVLADKNEKHGHKDKINKRNLRILVHKRQKLLAYLRKKERGGERWQNLVSTLGLTEGTWKGEISL